MLKPWFLLSSSLLFFILFLLTWPGLALARQPFEVTASPNFGWYRYDNYKVFRFSAAAAFKIPLSNHWQMKVSFDSFLERSFYKNLQLGLDYNFSKDWLSSFYVGAGLGAYLDSFPGSFRDLGSKSNLSYGYVEVGKRVPIISSWGLVYSPEIQFRAGDRHYSELAITPLRFSVLF